MGSPKGSGATRLLVLGGTGFIGREVCHRAIKLGFQVTSLSRRGRIAPAQLTPESIREWESKVTWKAGNALSKEPLAVLLANHDAVVHSVGLLFESAVNKTVSGSGTDGTNATYEESNRDTALVPLDLLRQQAIGKSPKPFVFVSAAVAPPIMPRYLSTKLEVEQKMQELGEEGVIRSIIFKPGVVYHHSKWSSIPLGMATSFMSRADSFLSRTTGFSIGIVEPTPLDLLVTAILRAVSKPNVQGVFRNQEMWELTSSENPEV